MGTKAYVIILFATLSPKLLTRTLWRQDLLLVISKLSRGSNSYRNWIKLIITSQLDPPYYSGLCWPQGSLPGPCELAHRELSRTAQLSEPCCKWFVQPRPFWPVVDTVCRLASVFARRAAAWAEAACSLEAALANGDQMMPYGKRLCFNQAQGNFCYEQILWPPTGACLWPPLPRL